MAESYQVTGKRILITGAARGIGAESAKRLAAMGARVSLVGLEPELLEQNAKECGPEATWVEADVTSLDAITAAVETTVERFGGLDVVISNAGIGSGGTVLTTDPAAFDKTIEINLLGTWRTNRAALPHIIESKGYILNVASAAAILHGPLMSAYAASKAGVEAFSNSLRTEVRHLGVSVGVVYLLWIDTDMVRDGDTQPAFARFRKSLKGPAGKTLPLRKAIDVIVEGIEQRKRRVFAPRSLALIQRLRGFAELFERDGVKAAPEIVRTAEAEVERQGAEAASMPERMRQLVK